MDFQEQDPATIEGMCEITPEEMNAYWESRYKVKCPYLELQPIMNMEKVRELERKKKAMAYRVPNNNSNSSSFFGNVGTNTTPFKLNQAAISNSAKKLNKQRSSCSVGPDGKPRKKPINYVLANKNVQSSVDWMPSKKYIHNTRDYNPKLNKNYPQRDEKRKIKIRGVHHGHTIGKKLKVDTAESIEMERSHLLLKRINDAIVYGNVYLPLMKGDKPPSITDLSVSSASSSSTLNTKNSTKRKGKFDKVRTTKDALNQECNARQRLPHPYQ